MSVVLEPHCYYKMDHKKRGLALIFNHEKFDHHRPRVGTHIDRDRLKHTLHSLNFDVRCYEDYRIDQIKNVFETGKKNKTKTDEIFERFDGINFSTKFSPISVAAIDHTDNDCLMVVVLSHGEVVPLKDRKGKQFTTILTHDLFSYLHATDNKYPLQTIWESFTDERCPTLRNKPRIFLISACQGEGVDEGLTVQDNSHSTPYQRSALSRKIETDITTFESNKHVQFDKVKLDRSRTLPQKDFLVVYSSAPGFYSYRDTLEGTWFIDAFCNVLDDSHGEIDLYNALTMINREVALEYESKNECKFKQIPCIVTMLTKLIRFRKKAAPLTNGYAKNSSPF